LGAAGLTASIKILNERGSALIEIRELELTNLIEKGLFKKGYEIVSPRKAEREKSGILSFLPKSMTASQLTAALAAKGVLVAPRTHIVRVAPHFYNSAEEVDLFLNSLP
jgi:selenocysteine lyase/cysteine desulfurase